MTLMQLTEVVMTTIERRGLARRAISLLVVLACLVLGPVNAATSPWPTREQIRSLHAEVDQLSAQLDTLEGVAGAEAQGVTLEAHWRAMQQHLVSVRANGCTDCGTNTAFDAADDPLPWATPRVSVPIYQEHVQTTLHAMHDRMSRLDHEKSPFERQRLLRQYWTRVYDRMQQLREPRP